MYAEMSHISVTHGRRIHVEDVSHSQVSPRSGWTKQR